jgi:hypothetical protein
MAVALASKFFLELSLWQRIALPVLGCLLFIAALLLHPSKRRNEGGKP